MSHPFGDLLAQSLHHKHGLSQSKLAAGILQSPSIITQMCQGKRLRGAQARERVVAIIAWLQQQDALDTLDEANALLNAAGMSLLRASEATEHALLRQLSLTPRPTLPAAVTLTRKTNLPAPLTSFVGRAEEVAAIAHAIATQRLVTLTGAGGVGKTRLATEVGIGLVQSESTSAFADGIWLVELAALSKEAMGATLAPQAIADLFKLSAPTDGAILDLLQEYLANKHLLLILDNCEHLVDSCAGLAQRLLEHCWRLHILATSREELRIPGETVYAVLPLLPPTLTDRTPERVLTSAAAQLFVERMGVTPSLLQTQADKVAAIAHICRQLDGIPLALELAAPLTHSMSLTEIAGQLHNQMALLTNTYRTAIPRHQTMHSALIWSYRLLARDEQQLLARVSVFADGWTLAAAKALYTAEAPPNVTSATLATLLNQLITKSLVLIESRHDQRRYRLLEPVRQFAHAQLIVSGEQAVMRSRHAHYFLALAEKMDQARDTLQEREWLQRLEQERNNIRAVNDWAVEHNEAEFAQRFNGFLCVFWIYCSSKVEANHWLKEALALEGTASEAERTISASMAEASALNAAGHAATLIHDFVRAQTLFERELTLRTKLDDRKGIANALRGISYALMLNNNLSQAQPYLDQALMLCRAAQDKWGVAWSLFDLGHLALVRGDLSAERLLREEALPFLQEQGINFGVFRTLLALGQLMRTAGNNERARQFYRDALQLQQPMHYIPYIADGLEGLAAIAAATHDPQRAGRLFGSAYAHRQLVAMPRLYHQKVSYERAVALTRSQLDPETWHSVWAAGCAMTLEQAVEYALT